MIAMLNKLETADYNDCLLGGCCLRGGRLKEGFKMEEQAKYGDNNYPQDITAELLSACEYMIEITGGSQHWQGKTNTALKKIEEAVSRARKTMNIGNQGGERQ